MGRALAPAAAAAAAAAVVSVSNEKYPKTSWPEVVGWDSLKAAYQINSERPDVYTVLYRYTTPLPLDYDANRVIIICDNIRRTVVQTPIVG